MKLAIFDVDGTLVDSQALIVGAMARGYESCDLQPPSREQVLSIVGLSLTEAISTLSPDLAPDDVARLVTAYKDSFVALRAETGGEASIQLYPGAIEALERLDRAGWLLGVATGKSRRGLDHLFAAHDLRRFFVTSQTADFHPSKPHPAMVETALAEAGVEPSMAVMIGDTTFDMQMGRAAGVRALGVEWGYHPVEHLHAAGAQQIIGHFDEIDGALEALWA
ncbi:HAD-IA family hydrolase [Pontivivens insulae]|uniref:Pyrophosphatase PpaX n=1 Tax=Pontivivens insulae TaxID=1639689 RepID=A0A2R8A6U2_9RHOB|nr:HAD-IA family hydrolase [Pontivivens insulae]RED17848.1 phosphoglycolate phosphatase [Pontivivens insulae]SPF27738.1 Pyrophosphatase PpaX [Pontivivens insulae]